MWSGCSPTWWTSPNASNAFPQSFHQLRFSCWYHCEYLNYRHLHIPFVVVALTAPFGAFAQLDTRPPTNLANLPSPEALDQCLKDKGIIDKSTPEQLQDCITSLGGVLSAPSGSAPKTQAKTTADTHNEPARQTTSASASPSGCPALTRTLSKGSKGADVTQLQNFLIAQRDLASGNNSGYFGALTEAAVKSFQKRNGIVSSGTPTTTGYGAVGPKTRAVIRKACSGQMP